MPNNCEYCWIDPCLSREKPRHLEDEVDWSLIYSALLSCIPEEQKALFEKFLGSIGKGAMNFLINEGVLDFPSLYSTCIEIFENPVLASRASPVLEIKKSILKLFSDLIQARCTHNFENNEKPRESQASQAKSISSERDFSEFIKKFLLTLDTRSRNVLIKARISSFDELFDLNEEKILSFRNAGKTTAKNILSSLEKCMSFAPRDIDNASNNQEFCQPTLFSEEIHSYGPQHDETPDEFKRAFKSLLDDLDVRSRNILIKARIRTFDELYSLTMERVLSFKNAGKLSAERILKAISELRKFPGSFTETKRPASACSSPPPIFNFANPVGSFIHFIETIEKKERNRVAFFLRFGFGEKGPRTLNEVGNKLSLSRERIRQLIRAMLNRIKNHRNKARLGELLTKGQELFSLYANSNSTKDFISTLFNEDSAAKAFFGGATSFFEAIFSSKPASIKDIPETVSAKLDLVFSRDSKPHIFPGLRSLAFNVVLCQ